MDTVWPDCEEEEGRETGRQDNDHKVFVSKDITGHHKLNHMHIGGDSYSQFWPADTHGDPG